MTFEEYLHNLPNIDAEALLSALDTSPSTSLRLNRRKMAADEAATLYPAMQKVEWCESGRRLAVRPQFTLNPLLHAGAFYVQDASSMIYEQIVGKILDSLVKKGSLKVLDFCAAPGGKTTAMINALPDDATVVANEYVASRGKILRENLEKWGYPGVITTGDNSGHFSRLAEIFDIVAVDAPCSGEGMMRKSEDARQQWSLGLVEQCVSLQRDILEDVANCVRPGGYLIYSTCTFNPDENERNAAFVCDELGFEPALPILDGVENCGLEIEGDIPCLRFMPHLTQGEGLFVTVFKKPSLSDNEAGAMNRSPRLRKDRQGDKKGKSMADINVLKQYLTADMELIEGKEIVTALPQSAMSAYEAIKSAGVNITGAGLPVGQLKGREYQPDSRVVLSQAYSGILPEIEVDESMALQYLRREAIVLPGDSPKGMVCIKYQGHPLGLVKNLGNRANNLYPQSWRIILASYLRE